MFSIEFYTTDTGNCPVLKYIENLEKKSKAKVAAYLEKLEKEGPNLSMPYSKFIKDGICELRIKANSKQHRILYFFFIKDKIILLHAFTKKTNAINKNDISIAQKRMEETKLQK
jgi:phage-related protein